MWGGGGEGGSMVTKFDTGCITVMSWSVFWPARRPKFRMPVTPGPPD